MIEAFDPTTIPLDLGAIPDINLNADLKDESPPYLGVVVVDEYQPNYNKDGYQWTLGIRPVDFVLRGEQACYFSRGNISTNPNSKMGMMLKAWQTVFGKSKQPVGRGHLRGTIGVFVNRNVSFGIADDGQERKARVTLVVRKADEAETLRAQGISQAVLAGQVLPDGSAPATPTAPAAAAFTDDDLRAMLAVVQGKTPQEFQMAALSSGLAPNLLNAVLSGGALAVLKKDGLVVQDTEGRVQVQAAAEEALV